MGASLLISKDMHQTLKMENPHTKLLISRVRRLERIAIPSGLLTLISGLIFIVIWANGLLALTLNLLSNYPLGLKKIIPMKIHSQIEYLAFPGFILIPILFFSDVPGILYVVPTLGVLNLLTNYFTEYK